MADVTEDQQRQKTDAALQADADKALADLRAGLANAQKAADQKAQNSFIPNSFSFLPSTAPSVQFSATPSSLKPEIFNNPVPAGPIDYKNYSTTLNVAAANSFFDRNATAHSRGKCAKYVRLACEQGGVVFTGHPDEAYEYNSYLRTRSDFSCVTGTWTQANAQVGDIVVFPPVKGHPSGHIQYCIGHDPKTGKALFRSDFNQNGFVVAKAYEGAPFEVFRHNNTVAQAPVPQTAKSPNRSSLVADARKAPAHPRRDPAYQSPQQQAAATHAKPGTKTAGAKTGGQQTQQASARPRLTPHPQV